MPRKTAPLPAADNIARAIKLLEWARAKGFKIGPAIVVGDVQFAVEDLRQAKIEGRAEPSVFDDDGDVYDGTEEPAEGTVG